MNETKHTKGPWRSGGCVVWQTDGDMICDLSSTRRLPDTIEANTERIVKCVNACEGINPDAIPDLLAALCEIRDRYATCIDGLTGENRRVLDMVLAAIRKATGEGE